MFPFRILRRRKASKKTKKGGKPQKKKEAKAKWRKSLKNMNYDKRDEK